MNETLGWLVIWSTIMWALGMLRKKLHINQPVKTLLLPGAAIDGAVRGISALCTATPVHAIAPFADGEPFCKVGDTKIRYLGLPLAILLRWLILLVATYMVVLNAPEFLESEFTLPLLDKMSVEETGVEWHPLSEFWQALAHLPDSLGIASPWSMLLAYALLTYFVPAGYNTREYVAALSLIGSIFVTSVVFSWLGVTFGFFSRGWFIQWLYVPEIWSAFSLLVVASTTSALFLGVLRFLIHLNKSMTQPSHAQH